MSELATFKPFLGKKRQISKYEVNFYDGTAVKFCPLHVLALTWQQRGGCLSPKLAGCECNFDKVSWILALLLG